MISIPQPGKSGATAGERLKAKGKRGKGKGERGKIVLRFTFYVLRKIKIVTPWPWGAAPIK